LKRICESSRSIDLKIISSRKWLMSFMSHICILRSRVKEIVPSVCVRISSDQSYCNADILMIR